MKFFVLLLLLLPLFLLPRPAHADGAISLDGSFDDWQGQPSIDDPRGDASKSNSHGDIKALYYATNPGEAMVYLMVQKWDTTANSELVYTVAIDTNNNDVTEADDRVLVVSYRAKQGSSQVTVVLEDGAGSTLATLASNENWGDDSSAIDARCEFGVSFADLGISTNQPITLRLSSEQSNSTDTAPFVQWSPANALGYVLLGLVTLLAALGMARRRERIATCPA